MKDKIIVAMLCITALQLTALIMQVNGALFGLAITVIAGLGGFSIGVAKGKKNK